ncbi:hypothetical protein RIR_jg3227.t1 [Rhizophagus irregularis DAOM 181602=DAOM 197198]|nr:hypothetical protein RIR_jg3227.t1 [Rhizophagus irregularis DAOM 181602=DAOM 197198]
MVLPISRPIFTGSKKGMTIIETCKYKFKKEARPELNSRISLGTVKTRKSDNQQLRGKGGPTEASILSLNMRQ